MDDRWTSKRVPLDGTAIPVSKFGDFELSHMWHLWSAYGDSAQGLVITESNVISFAEWAYLEQPYIDVFKRISDIDDVIYAP